MRNKTLPVLAMLAALSVTSPSVAVPAIPAAQKPRPATQPPQPIQIDADRAEITQQQNTSVYTGHVHVKQGTLEMSGDRLQLQRNAQNDVTAVMTGKPAATAHQVTDTGEVIDAKASQINYTSRDKTLVLQGNAEVMRGKDRITGNTIRYSAATQRMSAESQGGQAGQRVQITIQPNQNTNPAQ